MNLSQSIFSFLMGYFLYSLTEILLRGYTHWTMAVTGGIIMTIMYTMRRTTAMDMIRCSFAGAVITTAIELWVGIFDNIIMHWHVWDYSDMPMNFLGQICLPFSCFWFILCIPACMICGAIDNRLNNSRF